MSFQGYEFGKIVFNNTAYKKDIYITTSGAAKPRSEYSWRTFGTGHILSKQELEDNLDRSTELLIVGLGANSVMKIQRDALDFLESKKINLIAEDTLSATKTFNKLQYSKKTFGIFHLTC